MKYLPIVSYFLNVVLVILLFFKSAANQILLELYREKRKAKAEKRDLLIELRDLLKRLNRISFTVQVSLASWEVQVDPVDKTGAGEILSESMDKFAEVNSVISKNLPRYPRDLGSDYEEYLQVFAKFNSEIVDGAGTTKQRLREMNDTLSKNLFDIIDEVDKQLDK